MILGMPFVADVNGVRTDSTTVAPADWRALKGSLDVVMRCCGHRGHATRSPLGTQYFAHNSGANGCAKETAEHRLVKGLIVEAARTAGWVAEPEARGLTAEGARWVADVLVTHPERGEQWAFEVQWSHQTEDSYDERSERYAASGVHRTVWFARHAELVRNGGKSYAVLGLSASRERDGATTTVLGHVIPVGEAVTEILAGRLDPSAKPPPTTPARLPQPAPPPPQPLPQTPRRPPPPPRSTRRRPEPWRPGYAPPPYPATPEPFAGSRLAEEVAAVFGDLPDFLTTAAEPQGDAFLVDPVHWQAHVYMQAIHQPPSTGVSVTHTALTLQSHGFAAPGEDNVAAIKEAVRAFFGTIPTMSGPKYNSDEIWGVHCAHCVHVDPCPA